jgi:hypothetical protein
MTWRAASMLWLAAALAAQTDWQLQGGEGRVRASGPATHWLQGPRATAGLPAGDYEVHFGVDAAGKPRSLAFVVADGAVVCVGTDAAAAIVGDEVSFAGAAADIVCVGDPEAANYRVVATVAAGGEGAVGVVARCAGERQFYRFAWDRAVPEFRLERSLGGDVLVLARAAAPAADGASHALALQVDGFRLQACWDEAVVLQVFDGALSKGALGVWAPAAADVVERVVRQPVAEPRASAALVAAASTATFHAAVTVVPGHWHVLELALDRTHPPLPWTAAGLEPWLLLPPAAPVVMQADWRDSLGAGGIGIVGPEGVFTSELRWPGLTGLRKQCALVRAVLVSADGEVIAARTPAVPLRMP